MLRSFLLKNPTILFLSLSILLASLFGVFCTTGDVKYSDPVEALYDNYWINDNILQVQVEYTSNENLPYTMRRESSCAKARDMIDPHLVSLYPKIKEMPIKINIYKTVYYNKSDCRLIVHVSMQQLKRKLAK